MRSHSPQFAEDAGEKFNSGSIFRRKASSRALGSVLGIFGTPQCGYDTVEKADNQGAADKDDKVSGKKGHDKNERIIEPVGGNEQPDAKIQKKGAYRR